jgi:hypothetical protein
MSADPELGITVLHASRLTEAVGQLWIYAHHLRKFACYQDPQVGDIIAVCSEENSTDDPLFYELAAERDRCFWLLPIEPSMGDMRLERDALAS